MFHFVLEFSERRVLVSGYVPSKNFEESLWRKLDFCLPIYRLSLFYTFLQRAQANDEVTVEA